MHDNSKKDPHDGEYLGNIWGWKISLLGLAVIVLLTAFAAYRHYVLDAPLGLEQIDAKDLPADSLSKSGS